MRLSASPAVALLLALPSYGQLNYPPTRTVDASDTYFGTTYKDPYRWLENLKDKDVADWFKAQAELTDGLLAKIPGRDALKSHIRINGGTGRKATVCSRRRTR